MDSLTLNSTFAQFPAGGDAVQDIHWRSGDVNTKSVKSESRGVAGSASMPIPTRWRLSPTAAAVKPSQWVILPTMPSGQAGPRFGKVTRG